MSTTGGWEIESPDGSLRISRNQLIKAHAVYGSINWTAEPYLTYKDHPGLQASAMAGCLGAVLGYTAEFTEHLYEINPYFRQLVDTQLLAIKIDRERQAGLS